MNIGVVKQRHRPPGAGAGNGIVPITLLEMAIADVGANGMARPTGRTGGTARSSVMGGGCVTLTGAVPRTEGRIVDQEDEIVTRGKAAEIPPRTNIASRNRIEVGGTEAILVSSQFVAAADTMPIRGAVHTRAGGEGRGDRVDHSVSWAEVEVNKRLVLPPLGMQTEIAAKACGWLKHRGSAVVLEV